ncbi:protein DMP7 [Humulus lupulus]|uniref:protein DMP7 n=1 Tax=Humulus lupulus TaxID=3486 RepID=UPI002B416402|nr:protein DMP7 [Humulus lupulus]
MENISKIESEECRAAIRDLIEQQQPLLITGNGAPEEPPKQPKTPTQKAVRKTFKGTAHLANLLPTGSVLAFQILSPAITHRGQCRSPVSQTITLGLLACCAVSCFLLSFTDSFRDHRGKVRYGLATFRGLWIMDGSSSPDAVVITAEEASKFRLRAMDFVHALASLLVFSAVAAFDQNVVKCFYPAPSEEAKELLVAVPVAVGVVCSLFFVAFPSRRHGIGFPLSRH